MTSEKKRDLLAQGKYLLEQKKPKDALEKFRECVEQDHECHEAHFFMAKACAELAMPDEELAFLLEAHTLAPENTSYREAIGTCYYHKGDYREAYRYLSHDALQNTDRIETLNLLAECAEIVGNTSVHINALKKSLEINPEQNEVRTKLEVVQNASKSKQEKGKLRSTSKTKKKIAIFSNVDSFIGDIIAHLEKRYEVVRFNGSNLSDIAALMNRSDLCWFEWCDNLIIHASRLPKTAPIMCRLHRYEAFTNMPKRVFWQNVDHLICVSHYMADIVRKKFTIPTPIRVINNGIDFNKFTLPENKIYGKKIAYVGYIKSEKGPQLLLQCFVQIHEYDPAYTFHIAGMHQDPVIELYFDHMLQKLKLPVHYYGWVDQIAPWLEDKDYIISGSMIEGHPFSIIESIGRGLLPLVHNWLGSDDFYPGEVLFKTVDECLDLLKRYEQSDKASLARSYRDFMVERFSLEKQLEAIDELIEQYI